MTANVCQALCTNVTMKIMRKHLLYIILAIATLPILIILTENVQRLISLASPQKANLVIDTQSSTGRLDKTWSAYAQGGEEPPPMLHAVAPKLKELSPRYIRIDHIYDYYQVVKNAGNRFDYDFSELDKTVDDIITTGALPFFSLSYMPTVFTATGSVIDSPRNWDDWHTLVKKTIEHYSGINQKNLRNVYYEVWNEPELPQFGSWKIGGDKDYRLLYYHAATAANEATDTNDFYLGGPAVGSYYSNWINELTSYVTQNNLRMDFYSWHRYHKNPVIFRQDLDNTRKILSKYPRVANIPMIITEWGIDSENSAASNSKMAAAFSVASVIKFHPLANLSFAFEIKDGPPPGGGKWGLFQHEKDSSPLSAKPRFQAFRVLNLLSGEELGVNGEGTYISALASKSDQSINIVISNYDPKAQWSEKVPVTFTGLQPASWTLNYSYPLENTAGKYEIVTTDGSLSKSFLMPANSLLYLELTKTAELATFIPGKSFGSDDKALVLSASKSPLIFTTPLFTLRSNGNISFDLKPFWSSSSESSFLIFDAPYSTNSAIINKLFLAKQKKLEGNFLTFGIASNKEDFILSIPINDWDKDSWHRLETGWNPTGLSLTVDDKPPLSIDFPADIRNGDLLSFYPITAAIDNLKITLGENQEITRKFDGSVEE